MTYNVPADTQVYVTQGRIDGCKNAGLILQRLATRDAVNNSAGRGRWLRLLCEKFTPDERLIEASGKRWYKTTQGAHRFSMRTASRLVVGLGGKGALEIGLTLHRVTGLPYIPGSALKGVCRSYMLLTIAESRGVKVESDKLDSLDEALCEERADPQDAEAALYRRVFGTQGAAGQVVFHDAILLLLPKDQMLLEADTMTPHFPDYYRGHGTTPPADNQGPSPVPFVTVSAGVDFGFAVGWRTGVTGPDSDLEMVAEKLKEALQVLGIGAKTAAGYGVLEESRLDTRQFKDGFEVGDEVSGKLFDNTDGLWFTADNPYDERGVEAQIPKQYVVKQRVIGNIKARIIEIRDGDPLKLICDQIDTSKK